MGEFCYFEIKKTLWLKISVTKFQKSKSEMTVLLHFPLAMSWYNSFLLTMLFSWRNSQSKMATFHNFWKAWKNPLLNGWFLPLESVKIIFLWAHLHSLSERIILDPQTFIRDSSGWFLAMIPKCPLKSRNSHSTHFHSRSVKFKENIPIQSTALGEKKIAKKY